jgi:hypothetical protein
MKLLKAWLAWVLEWTAFGLEHFHEALVGQTAVFIVLDSGDSHFSLDEACEGGLF